MKNDLSKSFLFLMALTLVFSAVASFAAGDSSERAPAAAKSISACAKAADCKIVDLGCGRPGAVNQEVVPPDSTEACDAAANFDEASKLFSVDCKNKKCELVQKPSASKKRQ